MSKNRDIKDNIEIIELYLSGKIDYEISVSDLAKYLKAIRADDETLYISLLQKFPNDILGDLVLELPEHYLKEILDNIPSEQLSEAIDDLESDDATDLIQDIEEIDEEKAEEILSSLDEEDQEDIKRLSRYDDEKAGAYMQTEVFTASYDEKIQVAVDRLRELKKEGELENVHQVSIVGKLDRLIYTISLEDLITFNFDSSFKKELEGREDEFKPRYVIQERATDQIYKLAGVDDEIEHEESIFEAGKSRLIWLFLNLLTAILASAVIGQFEEVLTAYVALAVLMPIVASMGGNAGTQSLTIMVRQLALGEIDKENAKVAIRKEMILSIVNGLVFAVAIGFIALTWYGDGRIGFVIAASMFINLLCAGFIGSMIPLMLKRLGVDPAIGSTVVLTTSTDVIGFLSFLGLASWVLM